MSNMNWNTTTKPVPELISHEQFRGAAPRHTAGDAADHLHQSHARLRRPPTCRSGLRLYVPN